MEMQNSDPFTLGSSVIYALHGKCTITSVETREVDQKQINFYKLEPQKSSPGKITRQDTAIWLPVISAKERGLRPPMTKTEAETALALLGNGEFYFPLNEKWSVLHPMLEKCIRLEGGLGFSKVFGFLHILKRKWVVLPNEIARFLETITKLFSKELSDALEEPLRIIEEKVQKNIKQKILSVDS